MGAEGGEVVQPISDDTLTAQFSVSPIWSCTTARRLPSGRNSISVWVTPGIGPFTVARVLHQPVRREYRVDCRMLSEAKWIELPHV